MLALSSLARLPKPFRLLLLVAAAGLSAHLWSLNHKKPAENREYYKTVRKYYMQTDVIYSLLESLKSAGKADPEFQRILERNGIKELLEFRPGSNQEKKL
jgi:hypothetical protein